MADEYISKQSVIDYLNDYLHSIGEYNPLFDRGQRRALINAIQDISAIKVADVQPVKHGRWLSHFEYCKLHNYSPSGTSVHFWCSRCASAAEGKTLYCPNCGAKMDLKEDRDGKEER